MKIIDYEVYGIERAMIKSGLAHSNDPKPSESRLKTLGTSKAGSGKDCALKGIRVHATVQADHSWYLQFLRYHFIEGDDVGDIVTSTSKQHMIHKAELLWHPYVTEGSKYAMQLWLNMYNTWGIENVYTPYESQLRTEFDIRNKNDFFEFIIMNCPMGLELRAECYFSYLQLKTIYNQRKTHRMSSWKEFCAWMETLPKFLEFTQKEEK